MRYSLEVPISHMLNAFKALLHMYIVNLVVVPTLARDLVPRASHDHGKAWARARPQNFQTKPSAINSTHITYAHNYNSKKYK
jgi:hypothetical protein